MSTRRGSEGEQGEGAEVDFDNMLVGGKPVGKQDGDAEPEEFDEMRENCLLSKEEVYEDILKNIRNNKICLYYACVGSTYNGGKPIYDNQLLVDLLINYGYSITYILYAIDKLASEPFYDNGESLLISLDKFHTEMYDDNNVKHLKSKVVKQILKQKFK